MDLVKVNAPKVRRILAQKQLKHWWVAEQSGLHRSSLQRWLDGRSKLARIKNVTRVAQTMEVPVLSIIGTDL